MTTPTKTAELPSFFIGQDGRSITCLKCGMTSYSLDDVRYRYCGNCHIFHEERSQI